MTYSKPQLCDMSNSTLVVMDIQTRLCNAMPGKVVDRIIENTTLLLKSADILNIPVIATEQYPTGLGELLPDIQAHLPESTLRYKKTSFSCCSEPDIMEALNSSGRKQVILAGMEAHVCVVQTAVELQEHGFDVFIVADSICSRRLDNYQNALERLDRNGSTLVNTESVVFEWLRDAKHERFKDIAVLLH